MEAKSLYFYQVLGMCICAPVHIRTYVCVCVYMLMCVFICVCALVCMGLCACACMCVEIRGCHLISSPITSLHYFMFLNIYFYLCIYVCVRLYIDVCGGQKKALETLNVGLQAVVRCLMWALRSKCLSSARAARS